MSFPLANQLSLRLKLVILFVVIKVIPLILLAVIAWEGLEQLGSQVEARSTQVAEESTTTVGQLSTMMTDESKKALDLKSRDEIERLTTDTALAVAEFLKTRDSDILYAGSITPNEDNYRKFLNGRTRTLVDQGKWKLAEDKKTWIPADPPRPPDSKLTSDNPENKQDFNYRAPDHLYKTNAQPIYHEITYVGLDGQEKVKVSATKLISSELRNVSRKENTYAKAENYFAELKNLKPGDIYVSNVVGPYVHSHYYGQVTPEAAEKANVPFEPEKEAYAGKENPLGKRFQGIIRWATPVVKDGKITGYVTLALDHDHVMQFTDKLVPTAARYTNIPDASNGNYAFMWDYLGRSIAHPRHQSIIGMNPATGDYETPWLEDSLYKNWKASGITLPKYLAGVPIYDHQSRDKKPSVDLIKAGVRGLDCRYLNFAPQCEGWYTLVKQGGSGSFAILWSGVWKLTTAAAIPYYTGQYGKTPIGFGYVTIGANVDEFHKAATETKEQLDKSIQTYSEKMKEATNNTLAMIHHSMKQTALSLSLSTIVMIAIVIFIAIWLANLITKRVNQMTEGLGKIEQGDLDFRFSETSDDELGRLTCAINRMADGVQQSFKRVDEARASAEQANQMKSSFLASISHELRTPLNGILGFAELLKFDLENTELYDYAESIHSSGSHLLEIVNDLLDLASIEAGRIVMHPTPVNIRHIFEEVTMIHRVPAEVKGLLLTDHVANDVPETLRCDVKRLRQVLNNLLNNAIKFTHRGSIKLVAERCYNHLRISVADTGIGIAAEQQCHVFERFTQADHFLKRDHVGTGVGLSLVQELVVLMGGEMDLTSVLGEGSIFFFTLPLQENQDGLN